MIVYGPASVVVCQRVCADHPSFTYDALRRPSRRINSRNWGYYPNSRLGMGLRVRRGSDPSGQNFDIATSRKCRIVTLREAQRCRKSGGERKHSLERLQMKNLMLLAVIFGLCSMSWAQGERHQDATERLANAGQVLDEIMNTPDKGIPQEVFQNAKCIAVVPDMFKAAFVFGGKHGRGVATCRTASGGWSAPAFISVGGGSWGLQIGAQSIDLVMTVMNDRGMQRMLSNKFQVG